MELITSHIMELTKRLQMVFDLVPPCESMGDIGTDHGYMAVQLLHHGKAKHVIAGDVHKGPLASARQYIQSVGATPYIDCRLGDGLQVVKAGELDGAVLCGMGGHLMLRIIQEGPELLPFYVLQPQNGQKALRQFMVQAGYRIVREAYVHDMNKWYEAFLVVREDELARYGTNALDAYRHLSLTDIRWTVGAVGLAEKAEHIEGFIDHLIHIRQVTISQMTGPAVHSEKYKILQQEVAALEKCKEGLL